MRRLMVCLLGLALVAVFVGCPKEKPRDREGVMDTAEHHYAMGERAKRVGNWDSAQKEYKLAVTRDPKYVPALMGIAVVYAHKKNWEKAEEYRDKAKKHLEDDDKIKVIYLTHLIEYTSILKDKKWLDDCEDLFKKAQKIDPDNEKLIFTMGQVYMKAYKWSSAENMFKKVVDMNGEYFGDADVLWEKAQKINRARPGSFAAKQIALVEKITKADIAALFVEEMNLPEVWRKRGIKTWEPPAFMTPAEMAAAKKRGAPTASDINNHALKKDIRACLKLGIRGIEVLPDGKFYPNKPISRAEYALMLEDILIKVRNEPGISTLYVGEAQSKFRDLRTDHPAYNAAVVVTSRQIVPADKNMSGKFRPNGEVSGADALLIIRKMETYLQIRK